MVHLCVPQNQALGVCRGFVPDIQICGTHGRKNLVNAAIISNAEEEDTSLPRRRLRQCGMGDDEVEEEFDNGDDADNNGSDEDNYDNDADHNDSKVD